MGRGVVDGEFNHWLSTNRWGARSVEKTNAVIKPIQAYITKHDCDIFLYSGQIFYIPSSQFVDLVCRKENPKKNVLLFLTTPGGDPDAAYRMIRALRSRYSAVRLGIAGPCKSAGTLIAIGANELVMSETGELGPLDIQLSKPDELIPNSSGLDIFQALSVTTRVAFDAFETYMLSLVEHSVGNISTVTAAEIAKDLAVGLYAPITGQVDPQRLGEVQRAIQIAQSYAEKLGMENLKPKAMETLVHGYPSHGFVIDFEEAGKLFKRVVRLSAEEREIVSIFQPLLRHVRPETKFLDVGATFDEPNREQPDVSKRSGKRGQPPVSSRAGVGKGNGRAVDAKRPAASERGPKASRNGAAKDEGLGYRR